MRDTHWARLTSAALWQAVLDSWLMLPRSPFLNNALSTSLGSNPQAGREAPESQRAKVDMELA